MASYNLDLQASVDSTSVAKDAGEVGEGDLVDYLRTQLAERGIETSDDAWLEDMADGIRSNPNYLIDREPTDFKAERPDHA